MINSIKNNIVPTDENILNKSLFDWDVYRSKAIDMIKNNGGSIFYIILIYFIADKNAKYYI